MITKELAKQLIEQAEYNCSGEKVTYTIDGIQELSEGRFVSHLCVF